MKDIVNSKQPYETDVAVIGGGPSGFAAAVAAARAGARTILVEQGGCAGGMATQGLVGPFMTSYDSKGEEMIIRGLFSELVDRLVERGGAIHPSEIRAGTAFTSWITDGHDHVTPFDPEILKWLMDEMLQEAGVRILYHTTFTEPVLSGTNIAKVKVNSKSGMEELSAKVFIDCTGDGDLAYRCGVPCHKGRRESGTMQPATMFFRIGNVDDKAVEEEIEKNTDKFYRKDGVNYRSLHWRVTEARKNGDWSMDRVSIGLYRSVKPDEWNVNTSRIMGIDATDNESLTHGEIVGRQQVVEIFNFLRKYVPGCEKAKMLGSASTLGIRESRHIRGDYVMSLDDILDGHVPGDSILLAANSVDIHGRYGPAGNEYLTIRNGKWYGIPYRCLIPLGMENLLIAGRCVSASSEASGAIRVMPPCMGMGQAAGIAAAMASQKNEPVRKVEIKKLQKSLVEQGAFLPQD